MTATRCAAWGVGRGTPFDVPVDPDAPEARRWLEEELAKAPYQAARPTWFDRLSESILDWLGSLFSGTGPGAEGWLPVIVTVLVLAALVAAFWIFGMPRLNRRQREQSSLFGADDRRSAEDLRRAAQSAAAASDWDSAVTDMYRALARGLEERTVLRPLPGSTAHELAARAAAAFPEAGDRLATAADTFDAVRYLGKDAGERDFIAMADLERHLRSAPATGLSVPSPVAAP
jgi:hypothetical protein